MRLLVGAVLSLFVLVQGCAWTTRQTGQSQAFTNGGIKTAYQDGEAAFRNGDYVKARRVLMQIISNYPGENDLAQVQWLIARSYDLEGRTADALSEFKRFLLNYPGHPNAQDAEDRVRQLEQPVMPVVRKPTKAIRVIGNLSTDYEYGQEFDSANTATTDRVSARLDVQVRDLADGRGKLVFSGLRTRDLLNDHNDQARIQKLYADWRNVADTATVRLGRQPATAGGLSSRYDGMEVHYRPLASMSLDAASGFPVDFFKRGSVDTNTYFYEAGLSVADVAHTTGRFYAVRQFNEGITEREALGVNLQSTWGRLDVVGNADYDAHFGDFNDRFVSLDYGVRDDLRLSVARDLRKDPYLQMSTALLDAAALAQSVTSLSDWVALQGEESVKEMARAHTIDSTDTRVGLRWTISPMWSTNADYSHGLSTITQSDGSTTERALDRVSLYVAQYNFWRVPDIASLLVIHQTGSDLASESVYLNAGERLNAWAMLQLKGRVEYTNFKNGGTADSVRYVPGLSLELEPTTALSVTAEAEYTREDLLYGASLASLFCRLNVTIAF
ncbi:MAG: outer membrane protein assembly factor BamD [Nitrospirae bacterium]|nr:outer membrane protein assembly factor BamD [Nitrospirota bacterium]